VASGFVESALVVGVEKITDMVGSTVEAAVAETTDYDYEAVQGLTSTGVAGLVMQRYMREYKVPREAFAGFSMIAHTNAVNNPNAMYRKAITREAYLASGMLSDPLNLYDMGPYADGAAAVLLTRADYLPADLPNEPIRITGSGVAVDTLSLHDRPNLLAFDAARISVERACRQAGILPGDVDFFELCDAYTIYAALSLEAAGFAAPGEGWKLAEDGSLNLKGKLPILTMGGCKGRGNPLGAAGVYQVVEAVLQLRGQAGANQIAGVRRALVQCLGGPASTAAAHILERPR
jgi:acetyl-CoA C-acetyltransferase